MSHKHLKNDGKYTKYEHISLEMNGNSTNIHGNMLNVLQFSLQMFQKAMDILEFKPWIHEFQQELYDI